MEQTLEPVDFFTGSDDLLNRLSTNAFDRLGGTRPQMMAGLERG